MPTLTRKLHMFGIAALAVVILAACGGTTPANTQPAAGAATSAAPAATSAPAPTAATLPTAAATSAASDSSAAATVAPAATSAASDSSAATAPAATSVAPEATAVTAPAKLNLNTVTEDQLMSTIPSFSSRMVHEFMEYRPYISIQQFRKEIGKYVDADQVAMYEQYVFVPVDVDQADAATLQQLPGVDAAIADQLIIGRPYGSSQAFLSKLAGLVSAADAQQAAAYLAAA
jgi:DNA uptake protein ComE-like DNA-binding protein